MGTHLRELSESYLMNTNMTGFIWFSEIFTSLCSDKSIVSALEGLKEQLKIHNLEYSELVTNNMQISHDWTKSHCIGEMDNQLKRKQSNIISLG